MTDHWIKPTDEMPPPGKKVLVRQRTGFRDHYVTFVGYWIPAFFEEADPDDEDHIDYDEETDAYYVPEGWYENQWNWGDYSAIAADSDMIDHWMPLPPPPEGEKL